MLKNIFSAVLILFTLHAFGQDQNLKICTDSLIKALLSENYEVFVDKCNPVVVEMAGGKVEFAKLTKSTKEAFKAAGFKTDKIEYDSAAPIVKAGEELHTIVTCKSTYKIKDDIFVGKIFFLANSRNDGASWKFLDLESFDKDSIKDFIPNYNDSLAFPTLEAPTLLEK